MGGTPAFGWGALPWALTMFVALVVALATWAEVRRLSIERRGRSPRYRGLDSDALRRAEVVEVRPVRGHARTTLFAFECPSFVPVVAAAVYWGHQRLWPATTREDSDALWQIGAGLVAGLVALVLFAIASGVCLVSARLMARSEIAAGHVRASVAVALLVAAGVATTGVVRAAWRPTIASWCATISPETCKASTSNGCVGAYGADAAWGCTQYHDDCGAHVGDLTLSRHDTRSWVHRGQGDEMVPATFAGIGDLLAPPVTWVVLSCGGVLFAAAILFETRRRQRAVASAVASPTSDRLEPYRERASALGAGSSSQDAESVEADQADIGRYSVAFVALLLSSAPLATALAMSIR
jgi:hypothetical protein